MSWTRGKLVSICLASVGVIALPFVLRDVGVNNPSPQETLTTLRPIKGSSLRIVGRLQGEMAPRGLQVKPPALALREVSRLPTLILGNQLDRAIEEGQDLAGPERNDLAVALLTRGIRSGDSLDLLAALEALQDLAQKYPANAEIVFNRALALKLLCLRRSAAAGFEKFLSIEGEGFWAALAMRWILELRAEPLRDEWNKIQKTLEGAAPVEEEQLERASAVFSHQLREFAEDRILKPAAEAAAMGRRDESLGLLRKAAPIAHALAQHRQDFLLADEVAWISGQLSNQERTGDTSWLPMVAYLEGLRLRSTDSRNAIRLLRKASIGLRRQSSPMAFNAELSAEVLHFYEDVNGAILKLTSLCEQIPQRYPELIGRCLWMKGIALASAQRFEEALISYQAAFDRTERASGAYRAATLDLLEADLLDARGEIARSWDPHRRRAIQKLAYQPDPQRRYGALIETAQTLGRDGRPELALIFLEEAESVVSLEYDREYARVEIDLEVAANLNRMGRSEPARQHLREAARLLDLLRSAENFGRLEARYFLVRGQIDMLRDPESALADFRKAASLSKRAKFRFEELPTVLALAEALRRQRRDEPFQQTLILALERLEATRRETNGLAQSADTFRRSQSILDQLMLEAIRQGDSVKAFSWSERGRAQGALDAWRRREAQACPGAPAQVLTLAKLESQIPGHVILLEYAFAGDELLCWVVRRGTADFYRLRLEKEELATEIRRLMLLLEKGVTGASFRDLSETLYSKLIEPLGLAKEAEKHWIIVADDPIALLPFGALIDPKSKKYLAESTSVGSAPSAELFLRAVGKASELKMAGPTVLVALEKVEGGPYAFLRSLPNSLVEAERVAFGSSEARRLFGRSANRIELAKALQGASTLHFAGHGLSSQRWPEGSGLVFSPSDPTDDGLLRLADLELLPSQGLRLVTLSACETLRGYESGREGNLGIAQGFFAAGVPAVLGTRWAIGDRTAPSFVENFYHFIRLGQLPQDALSSARRKAIRSETRAQSSPESWAAFEVLGW